MLLLKKILLNFLHSLRDNVQSNQVIIGMFDRDTPLLTEINGSRVDIRNEKFVKIGKNIFPLASSAALDKNTSEEGICCRIWE